VKHSNEVGNEIYVSAALSQKRSTVTCLVRGCAYRGICLERTQRDKSTSPSGIQQGPLIVLPGA